MNTDDSTQSDIVIKGELVEIKPVGRAPLVAATARHHNREGGNCDEHHMPPEVASDSEVLEFVKSRRGGIGYVSVDASLEGVKVLEVTG